MKLIRRLSWTLPMMILCGSCSGLPRPKGLICIAHLASDTVSVPYSHCYDMEADFDSAGQLIPGHHGKDIPLVMDKHVHMDAQAFANLSGYVHKLQDRLTKCEAGQ